MNSDKRQTLKTMAQSAGALATMSIPNMTTTQKISKASMHHAVIVIGAGVAGLAAAAHLKLQGIDVLVIEGRSRLGGRIHTSREWPDAPIDLGASWIHGIQGNPITLLAKRFQATTVPTSYESAKLYIAQDLQAVGVTSSNDTATERFIETALHNANKLNKDISLQEAINQAMLTMRPTRAWMAQLQFAINSRYEQEYAGDASELSAWHLDDHDEFAGGDVFFPKGYAQIVDGLAKGLNILTEHRVQGIDYQFDRIKVITEKAIFTANQVLVTVPLGVLKAQKINFTPNLPKAKEMAIAKLGMGLLNKHFLRFDKVFWDKNTDWHEFLSAEKGRWTEWVSFAKVDNLPVLLGFSSAHLAKQTEGLSDADIMQEAMQALREMFGKNIPKPIAYQFTRWSQDPFALGSYSFNAVGSSNADRKNLAAPIGQKIYWAGEACHSQYWGTLHGAYLSGLAQANAMLLAKSL